MSTPYDPGRPEDRPGDQPGYPAAPPPQDYGQQYPPDYGQQQYPQGGQPGQSHQGYPPAPDYGQQYPPGYGQQYPQGPQPGQSHQGYPPAPDYGQQQPYAGGPGGGYGTMPGYGQPPGRPDRTPPMDVIRAVQLMFARVIISVIATIITFSSGDAIRDSIRESDPQLTPDEVDAAYNVGLGVAIVLGLVFAVLYILLAMQVRKGKNWARIVTWVLAGIGVLGGLLGLLGAGTGLEKGLSVVQLLIDAAIIVLLARKPANEYFAAMKDPRY